MRVPTTILGIVLPIAAAAAQAAIPDAHWGGRIYPEAHEEMRLSLAFNRFTVFSKTGDPNNPSSRRYNAIDETSGFNIATLSLTDEFRALGTRWTKTLDIGGGPTSDQPTKFLQNEYIHHSLGQDRVPVGRERDATEFLGGFGARMWFGDREPHAGKELEEHHSVLTEAYLGGGVAASSLYHDSYLQTGGTLVIVDAIALPFDLWPRSHFEVLASDRVSWLYPSAAYPDVAHFANVAQAGFAITPSDFYRSSTGAWSEIWARLTNPRNLIPVYWPSLAYEVIGRPRLSFTATYDSGLFVDLQDSPIETWFFSFAFDWPTGLRAETYNDFANGTDWGPTFGLRISWDLGTAWRIFR